MKFYEIDEAILECIDFETGEIIDIERLRSLEMEKDRKIEGIGIWIKSLRAEAEAIKAEEKLLKERRQVKENKIESLTGFLDSLLDGTKFETSKVVMSYRKSTVTEVNETVFLKHHKKLCTKIPASYKYDKSELKKLIKEGEKLKGVTLIEKNNLGVK